MGEDVCLDPLRENGRRKEDHNLFARLANLGIRYHWLATLLFAFFLMLGFGFRTPAQAFADLRALIDHDRVVDSLSIRGIKDRNELADKDRREMRNLLEALVIMQCRLNTRVSQDNRLPCRRLFREWGLE